jgi:hypothetical protein
MRFNNYMAVHFTNCRLIARAYDNCRGREVTLHAIPGEWDVVGVSDGTDAWIAPASAGLFFATATGNCADLLRRLKAGETLPPVPDAPNGRARTRVRLEDDQEQTPRSRTRVRI